MHPHLAVCVTGSCEQQGGGSEVLVDQSGPGAMPNTMRSTRSAAWSQALASTSPTLTPPLPQQYRQCQVQLPQRLVAMQQHAYDQKSLAAKHRWTAAQHSAMLQQETLAAFWNRLLASLLGVELIVADMSLRFPHQAGIQGVSHAAAVVQPTACPDSVGFTQIKCLPCFGFYLLLQDM